MEFQYELSEQFAQSFGVKLKIKAAGSVRDPISKLLADEGDLIAYNLPTAKEWKNSLIYYGEEVITHQIIIQRADRSIKPLENVTGLVGKDVYVKSGKYYKRLINLDRELGGGIHIHKVSNDSIAVEDLIIQISQGKVSYIVANNDITRSNTIHYSSLNIGLSIGFDRRASQAVHNDYPQLTEVTNKWHKDNMTSPVYTSSMRRYFEISKVTPRPLILFLWEGKISHFDYLFKEYAPEIDWDWRPLASLACTESNFDIIAISWAGAKGLMQLILATARVMGMLPEKGQSPEENIKATTKCIVVTARSLSAIPPDKRINFILISYDSGIGHVLDTVTLAEKYGENGCVWRDSVESLTLLKSNEEYFTDPICENGYYRDIETYNFVRDTTARFEQYKKKIRS